MLRDLDEKLSWDVETKSIFSGDIIGTDKIDGYKAITRNDNGGILSVMRKSYSPMLNSEFVDAVEKVKEISGFSLAGYNEYKGGKKVLGFLENNKDDFYIGGNKIQDYLLLGNSFDGSTSFFQGTSTVLIRCHNQFSKIQMHSKIRHTSQFKHKLDEFYKYLSFYFTQRDEMYKTFNRMGDIRMSEDMREQLINFVLGVKEISGKEISAVKQRQIDILRSTILSESKDLGENIWGAFNGITKFTTHELHSANPTFGNIFGQQADINERAFSFAESLM